MHIAWLAASRLHTALALDGGLGGHIPGGIDVFQTLAYDHKSMCQTCTFFNQSVLDLDNTLPIMESAQFYD